MFFLDLDQPMGRQLIFAAFLFPHSLARIGQVWPQFMEESGSFKAYTRGMLPIPRLSF
jgi:hypothetical protein